MADIIIRAENLSKLYHIGALRQTANFREALTNKVAGLFGRGRHRQDSTAFWALKEVGFEVKRGDVLGIVGRNGAGKSTMLKILSRIMEPTTGRIEMHGRLGTLLEVGTGFHPELSGRENVFLNGAILGMKRAEVAAKFDEIVAFAEIEDFIDTPVKRYSTGMYVRLAFAVAAHLDPEILILDEVLAVGDVMFQKKCLAKIQDVAKLGRTILFVSHNPTAVKNLCNRALVLQGGRIVADDTPANALNTYLGIERRISQAEIVWPDPHRAPGTEIFRLHRVRLMNSDGVPSGIVPYSEAFNIEIEYWNIIPGKAMGATVVLFNEEGALLFSSISNHEPIWHGRPRPVGLFRSSCRVPGQLLAEGHYTISVLLWGEGYSISHREDAVIRFEVAETPGARGDYYGGWSGIIRPMLAWKAELIEPSVTNGVAQYGAASNS